MKIGKFCLPHGISLFLAALIEQAYLRSERAKQRLHDIIAQGILGKGSKNKGDNRRALTLAQHGKGIGTRPKSSSTKSRQRRKFMSRITLLLIFRLCLELRTHYTDNDLGRDSHKKDGGLSRPSYLCPHVYFDHFKNQNCEHIANH